MPKKLSFVTVSLRISSIIYILISVIYTLGLLLFPKDELASDPVELGIIIGTGVLTIILCILLVVFIEVVINALKKGKQWAWIAGICLGGLYVPSLFLVLGVCMLIGLLDEEVKQFCEKKK
jgi:hypothetical protein